LAPQHRPIEQRPAQAFPQPPQWFGLFVGSTHVPPQLSWPVGQHLPARQAPPGQSASLQHRELAMQAPLQSLKPELHVKWHAPLAQVAVAFATAGQAAQRAPHEFTLVFERQRPLQSCVPAGHTPMQAEPAAMQTLAQSFSPVGQLAPQVVPSQVAVPPCGDEQAEQEAPHDAGEVSSEQPPLQAWKPVPHEKPHRLLALHVAVPWVTAGQSAAVQQLAAAMHAVAQLLYPFAHVKSQTVPLHVAAPLSGTGQGSQLAPHELTLVFVRHWPPQACVVAGQVVTHDCVGETQAPAHSCWPMSQAPPQLWPSHVAAPPAGGVQGAHDMPQLAGSLLSTHRPLQTWKPPLHVRLHVCVAVQVPVPFAGVPQSALVQQPPMGTQVASGQAL